MGTVVAITDAIKAKRLKLGYKRPEDMTDKEQWVMANLIWLCKKYNGYVCLSSYPGRPGLQDYCFGTEAPPGLPKAWVEYCDDYTSPVRNQLRNIREEGYGYKTMGQEGVYEAPILSQSQFDYLEEVLNKYGIRKESHIGN